MQGLSGRFAATSDQEAIMDTAPVTTTTSSAAGAQLYSMRWIVAAVVLAANTMDLLDATIVNGAGPSIHRELGGGASTIQWLSAGYTLAFAVLLIAGARLGDILGRRRLFLAGSAGFTLFSAACAVAPTIGGLVALPGAPGRVRRVDDPAGIRPDEAGLYQRGRARQGAGVFRAGNGSGDARRAD